MEITHIWTKLLPHKGGKEKSHIEVLSAQVMPNGKEASRRQDFWYENEKQLHPIVTGVVYDRVLREAQSHPERHYYVTQFDAESSPDAPYNLPMNNPNKIDPKTTFIACAAMARQLYMPDYKPEVIVKPEKPNKVVKMRPPRKERLPNYQQRV